MKRLATIILTALALLVPVGTIVAHSSGTEAAVAQLRVIPYDNDQFVVSAWLRGKTTAANHDAWAQPITGASASPLPYAHPTRAADITTADLTFFYRKVGDGSFVQVDYTVGEYVTQMVTTTRGTGTYECYADIDYGDLDARWPEDGYANFVMQPEDTSFDFTAYGDMDHHGTSGLSSFPADNNDYTTEYVLLHDAADDLGSELMVGTGDYIKDNLTTSADLKKLSSWITATEGYGAYGAEGETIGHALPIIRAKGDNDRDASLSSYQSSVYDPFTNYAWWPDVDGGTAQSENTYYAAKYGDVWFVVLDTNLDDGTTACDGYIGYEGVGDADNSDQGDWLAAQLGAIITAEGDDASIVVVMHDPLKRGKVGSPYADASNATTNSTTAGSRDAERELLIDLFFHKGVDLILCGDTHVMRLTNILGFDDDDADEVKDEGEAQYRLPQLSVPAIHSETTSTPREFGTSPIVQFDLAGYNLDDIYGFDQNDGDAGYDHDFESPTIERDVDNWHGVLQIEWCWSSRGKHHFNAWLVRDHWTTGTPGTNLYYEYGSYTLGHPATPDGGYLIPAGAEYDRYDTGADPSPDF